MKKMILLVFILLMIINPNFLLSQTFTWQVASTFIVGNPGDFLSNHTYLLNNTTSQIDVRVIILNYTLPTGWSGSYCPPNGCIPFSFDTSQVFTLDVSNFDSLLIDFSTNMTPAVGTVSVKVENFNNPVEFIVKDFAASTDPTDINYDSGILTGRFQLYANYPNPFNPSTTIPFEIDGSNAQQTIITIYNVIGQIIKTVLDDKLYPGVHQVTWDGKDTRGKPVSSGLYFYELRTANEIMMGKMILLK